MVGKLIKFAMRLGVFQKTLAFIGKIGIKKKLLSGEDMRDVLEVLMPGDAILVKAYGEASGLLSFGTYTHCILKAVDPLIIMDVTAPGMRKRDVLNTFVGVQKICVMRPRLSEIERVEVAISGRRYLDVPYDFLFSIGKEEMYCSEFYFHCYNDVNPDKLELRDRFGFMTISPDDIAKCSRLFDKIIERG